MVKGFIITTQKIIIPSCAQGAGSSGDHNEIDGELGVTGNWIILR